jgi:hypothetical protein
VQHSKFAPLWSGWGQKPALPHRSIAVRFRAKRRHLEAERLGGLEIDDELKLRRVLYRQVGRLVAAQYAIDI